MTDDVKLTVPDASDWPTLHGLLRTAFNQDHDEESAAADRITFEPERALLAWRHGEPVGTGAIHTRRLAVPGGAVPAAHVTLVAVAPTARRQGVLTSIMHRQLADLAARGDEPVAVLWASEGRIYQRYGYGLAVRRQRLQVDTREVRLPPGPADGRLHEATPAAVRNQLAQVFATAWPERPGWSERHDRTWSNLLADPAGRRDGSGALRAVLHHDPDGTPDGYALYRLRNTWTDAGPAGEVAVIELVAPAVDAYAQLWRFLLTVDLTRSTSLWCAAVDEPLTWMVNEPRRLAGQVADALWVRLVDLPAALAARRYPAAVDLVLEVDDDLVPANRGRWRLTTEPGPAGHAHCSSTVDDPDLRCDVRALASAYLGDASFAVLAAAGQVEEVRSGAVASASSAFGWHRAPAATEAF